MARLKTNDLSELHSKLAAHMLRALEQNSEAIELLDTYRDDLPMPVVLFLERAAQDNPALLTSITKFLKDNQITAVIEDTKEMSELQQRLIAKRKAVTSLAVVED